MCAAERGSTPLRDPCAPAALMSPEVAKTPGVLQIRQMNQADPGVNKGGARPGSARDTIPAHRQHVETPALKGAASQRPPTGGSSRPSDSAQCATSGYAA